ncbi:MAG TPA: hypothetical protein VMG10_08825, partial [Gemmataceae bacterium]|nr:hypothetical protein [Gemmataceae bacterium]
MDSAKRIQAPSDDGAVVAVPPLHTVGDILTINRQRLQTAGERLLILDRPLTELRRQARYHALRAGSVSDGDPDILFVAGHQPELFHPGVWVKNFALYGLARKHHAASLNLVVDDDAIKTTALRVPEPPHVRRVLFDRWTGAAPYEERTIVDRALFAGFAERVGELTRHWPYQPLLPAFWAEVLRQAERTSNLGECFAAARRTFEQAWGCHNREVPLSTLCDSEPFAYFACHLLAKLPYFHSLYNAIVAEYRRRHGIRDRQHPVPDLAADGDWLEAPFWIWRTGASRRERLFARLGNDRVELRSGDGQRDRRLAGPLFPTGETPVPPLEAWREWQSRGLKIRTRALTTTLYARLFLADLFLHGIGGGIYDELTDELLRRFYGCEPPEYLVLSATRWLPLPRPAATANDCRRLRHELRDVHYNPQRHLDGTPRSEHLSERMQRKHEWIARHPATSAERRERFRMLRTLTGELRHPLRPREEQLRRQLRDCEQQLRTNAVLQRRDYSFCLFPESVLRPFCTQFLH